MAELCHVVVAHEMLEDVHEVCKVGDPSPRPEYRCKSTQGPMKASKLKQIRSKISIKIYSYILVGGYSTLRRVNVIQRLDWASFCVFMLCSDYHKDRQL